MRTSSDCANASDGASVSTTRNALIHLMLVSSSAPGTGLVAHGYCSLLSAAHAARCVACHGVRSHAVPVALVGECSMLWWLRGLRLLPALGLGSSVSAYADRGHRADSLDRCLLPR